MTTTYPFTQVDVFSHHRLLGNPVAVVHDATGLSDEAMQTFARWTNLMETTFLLPPTDPAADYRLRIFTPWRELTFAGHPTLGSAHAWREAGGVPHDEGRLVQECGAGLVTLREVDGRWAFQAPPFVRSGPVDPVELRKILTGLGLDPASVRGSAWIDNGPGWLGVELPSAEEVLAVRPDPVALAGYDLGLIGPHEAGEAERIGATHEVRALIPGADLSEDPVTGSLNAGLAMWLVPLGRLPREYVARQGTVIGRDGRVHVRAEDDGGIWVGGATTSVVSGTVAL